MDPESGPSTAAESRNASWVLRLLLGAHTVGDVGDVLDAPPAPSGVLAGLEWDPLLELVRANGGLVRTADRLETLGIAFAEPPPEDQLVLQGLQRVPGRLRIALSDVVFTVSTLRRSTLDWDYVIATARRYGALPGLGCYLGYVDQIHRDVFARPLLSDTVPGALPLEGWGRIAFRDGGYRFPIVRANGRLYWGQLRHRIASGDWGGAGRLFLIPLVAGSRAGRRVTGGTPPPAPRGAGPRRAAVGEGRTIDRSPRAPMNTVRTLVLDRRTIEARAGVRPPGRAGYWVAVGGKRRWPLAGWARHR